MINRILSLLLFPLMGSQMLAREGKLEVRFLAERLSGGTGEVVLFADEKVSAPFALPMNNLSAPQLPPARLFQLKPQDQPTPLATVQLPQEGDSFVVLLLPTAKGIYNPVVMPYRNPRFKGGDIYFHNIANKTVLGYVGSAKFLIKSGDSSIVTPQGARAEKFYDVGLGVREKEGDRVLATTRWPEDRNTRYYVFFYVDPKTKLVTYRAVDEFVNPG